MRTILKDKAGGLEVWALNYANHFADVGMVETVQDMILSFDFILADRDEHFDSNSLASAFLGTFENMRIFSTSQFGMHHVVFHIAKYGTMYPHLISMASEMIS